MQPWIDHDEGVRVIPRPNGGFDYVPIDQDDRMTPAEIKAARHALGMTQAQLAAALELAGDSGARTVRNWEQGRNPITGPARVLIRTWVTIKNAFPQLWVTLHVTRHTQDVETQ